MKVEKPKSNKVEDEKCTDKRKSIPKTEKRGWIT